MPIRGVVTGAAGRRGAVVDDRELGRRCRGRRRSWRRSRPNAWHSLPGPSVRRRSGRPSAARPHHVDAARAASTAAQQHGLAVAVGAGDDVGAVVHPVGEVHVEVAGRPEHRPPLRGVGPRNEWLAGSSERYASTSTMRPAHGPATSTLLSSVGATTSGVRGRRTSRAGEPPRPSRQASACPHPCDAATRDSGRAASADRSDRARRRPARCAARTPTPGRRARRRPGRGGRRRRRARAAACPVARWLRGRARRRWRGRRGTACRRATSHSARSVADVVSLSAAACHPLGTNVAVSIMPADRDERQRRPGRRSRTAAPCPPAGRGCRPAAGPSASPAAR